MEIILSFNNNCVATYEADIERLEAAIDKLDCLLGHSNQYRTLCVPHGRDHFVLYHDLKAADVDLETVGRIMAEHFGADFIGVDVIESCEIH
jgi:hypothetical protein